MNFGEMTDREKTDLLNKVAKTVELVLPPGVECVVILDDLSNHPPLYVSDIDPDELPSLLRSMADGIESTQGDHNYDNDD